MECQHCRGTDFYLFNAWKRKKKKSIRLTKRLPRSHHRIWIRAKLRLVKRRQNNRQKTVPEDHATKMKNGEMRNQNGSCLGNLRPRSRTKQPFDHSGVIPCALLPIAIGTDTPRPCGSAPALSEAKGLNAFIASLYYSCSN
jgi:hypothetical protein